jgi:integrase
MSVRRRVWTTAKGEEKQSWVVDYADGSGERHIQTFSRKKEADDYHATVRVDVRKGLHIAPSKSVTVAEAAEAWIKRVEAEGRERGTVEMYKQHVRLHIEPELGRHKLANLSHKAIENFRGDLLKKLSRPMARKVLVSFKSILRCAKFAHLADDVRISSQSREQHRLEVGLDIPTPAEIKRLIEAATPGHQKAMFLIAATCGLRASELRGLRWRDLNLKDSVLNVSQRADRWRTIGPPKSKAGIREIPLAPETLQELKQWKLACPPTEADLVFPTRNGAIAHHISLFRSVGVLQKRAKVLDKSGKPKYGLHSFRHFFASWCLNRKPEGRELRPQEVQSLLGHSSIVMTMDVYGHLFPRSSDKAELAQATRALLG